MYKPHKRPTGESCYNAILTEEKVKAIRENMLSMTDKEQSQLYGVSANTIFRVRNFEAWCHV